MPTNKKKIQVYENDEIITKFKVLTAIRGQKSMSDYAGKLIKQAIAEYEAEHGPIPTEQIFGGGKN